MRYVRPHYYDGFHCLAGRCPSTCCAGWQIAIDGETLQRYEALPGRFGELVRQSVDWRQEVFRQKEGRCAFLDGENLCRLYTELGEEGFCRTCRTYPRHEEEFDGVRELSLTLSCPAAARLIVGCQEPARLLETETDQGETEDYGDFDYPLYTRLVDARIKMMEALRCRDRSLDQRMGTIWKFSWELQHSADREDHCRMGQIIENFNGGGETAVPSLLREGYRGKCEEFKLFLEFEILSPQWEERLAKTWELLYEPGEAHYLEVVQTFEKELEGNPQFQKIWEIAGEQLFFFFLYTYFCGAVYDGIIFAKVGIASFSVGWIREFFMANWSQTKRLLAEDLEAISWAYAREVEHDDENLLLLEDRFHMVYQNWGDTFC